MAIRYVLITGRTTKQGTGAIAGKRSAEYLEATGAVGLSAADLARSGLVEGDRVRIRSAFGETYARVKVDDVPEGVVFMAYGPTTGRLTGGDTAATGMPDSKGIEVEIERASEN